MKEKTERQGEMISSVVSFVVISMSTKYSLALLQQVRRSFVSQRSGMIQKAIETTAEPIPLTSSTKSIADFRKEYSQQGLIEEDPNVRTGNPFFLFNKWLNDAIDSKLPEPNAMCLSTCVNNRPSSRYVLLKGYDERGFVWYTNYLSRKSEELAENPYAAITFFWVELERSVRIEGKVEKVSAKESDDYFQSRPRGSQIGAWSSKQSHEIQSREQLELQEQTILQKFHHEGQIPRPPHWGGFRLIPNRIEFWKGRQSRLHDRIVFERNSYSMEDTQWTIKRLQP